MEIKKIKDLEFILKNCFSNNHILENLNDIDYINKLGNAINYLKDFNILINEIKSIYSEEEIKDMLKETNLNINEVYIKGSNSTKLLETIYINKLDNLLEKIDQHKIFNQFYIYTELAKLYLDFNKEDDIPNVVKNINKLIDNNSQEILNGYLNKSLLTYQDCQFINDILINAKEKNIELNLTQITIKLKELSVNDNYYINVGPKDSLLYIEDYNRQKINEEDVKYYPQDLI